jgi:hypothetical protein
MELTSSPTHTKRNEEKRKANYFLRVASLLYAWRILNRVWLLQDYIPCVQKNAQDDCTEMVFVVKFWAAWRKITVPNFKKLTPLGKGVVTSCVWRLVRHSAVSVTFSFLASFLPSLFFHCSVDYVFSSLIFEFVILSTNKEIKEDDVDGVMRSAWLDSIFKIVVLIYFYVLHEKPASKWFRHVPMKL